MDETKNDILVQMFKSMNNFQDVMIENMKDMKEDIKGLKEDVKGLKLEVRKNAEIENAHLEENKRLWEENKKLWVQNEENRKNDIRYLNEIIFKHEVYIASALGDPNAEKMKSLKKKVI